MKTPYTLKIAAFLLALLSLFSAGLGAARQFGLLEAGFNRSGLPQLAPGQMPNPPAGANNPFQGRQAPDFQNPEDMNPNLQPRRNQSGSSGFTLLRGLNAAQNLGGIVVGLAGLTAALGLWMAKRWAAILAVFLGAVFILLSIPSVLAGRIFMLTLNWNLVETISRLALGLTVIVLILLPASRRAYTQQRPLLVDLDDEEEEDEENGEDDNSLAGAASM